jgi:hypothetical protein
VARLDLFSERLSSMTSIRLGLTASVLGSDQVQFGSPLSVRLSSCCLVFSFVVCKKRKRKKENHCAFVGSFSVTSWSLTYCHQYSSVLKKLFLCTFAATHRCLSCALTVAMGPSSTSSGSVSVLRCPMLFDGTNY